MMLEALDETTRDTLQTAFNALIQTPSLHFFLSPVDLDGVAVLTAKNGFSLIDVEVFVGIIAICIILLARNVWKKETK